MELVPLYPVLIAATQGRGRIMGVERDPDHAGVRFGLDPGCRPGSGTVTAVPPWFGFWNGNVRSVYGLLPACKHVMVVGYRFDCSRISGLLVRLMPWP